MVSVCEVSPDLLHSNQSPEMAHPSPLSLYPSLSLDTNDPASVNVLPPPKYQSIGNSNALFQVIPTLRHRPESAHRRELRRHGEPMQPAGGRDGGPKARIWTDDRAKPDEGLTGRHRSPLQIA